MSSKETREQREERLQREHDKYMAGMATRPLPWLRSTIAGAGGQTNESVRRTEEKVQQRLKRLSDAEVQEKAQEEFKQQHSVKIEALNASIEKKRQKRLKKKKRRMEKSLSESGSGSESERGDSSNME